MRKIPVIIDCDPGHDDMVALILALGSECLDVKLITNVAGNKVIEKVTNNTLNILNYCGADVEVAAGARRPLVRGYERTDIEGAHGLSGLDGFEFPKENPLQVSERTALEAAADILKRSEEKVTFICTGPLSNMGLLIRAYPDLCNEKIEQISLMGGTCHFILTKPFMEFNTYFDAEASKIVFESGIPVIMYGYDVTYKALFQEEFLFRLEKLGNRTGHMMAELLRKFTELHNRVWLDLGGCPIHDACAVAGVIDRGVIQKSEKMYVQIMTEPGPLSGATVCDYEHRSKMPENVEVIFGLDLEKLLNMILESARRLA